MEINGSMSIFAGAVAMNSKEATAQQNTRDNAINSGFFSDFLKLNQSANDHVAQPLVETGYAKRMDDIAVFGSLSFLEKLWSLAPERSELDASSPNTFVRSILVPSTLAAQKLGTSTAAVIAVAALETGWGKHIVETDSGGSSYNLFGIKATHQDSDRATSAKTTEYIAGVKQTLTQPFMRYGSIDESVADFADFIHRNPRYTNALAIAQDPDAFIDAIHLAGYATDPNYAGKVKTVIRQVESILHQNALKASGTQKALR